MPVHHLFVLCDDLPRLDGSKLIDQMPYCSALFKTNGVEFTRFRCTTPLCGPFRVQALTGLESHETGHDDNDWAGVGAKWLADKSIAVAHKNAGYLTALSGKYVNWHGADDIPRGRDKPPGWDFWRGYKDDPDYLGYTLLHSDPGDSDPMTPVVYGSSNPNTANGNMSNRDAYTGDYAIRKLALFLWDLIDSQPLGDEPLFCWFAPPAVHTPHIIEAQYASFPGTSGNWNPGNFDQRLADNPPHVRCIPSYGAVENMTSEDRILQSLDDAVERLVKKFESSGRTTGDHSLCVTYVSDNAIQAGSHGLAQKTSPYLSASHVPCYVHWTGNMGAGLPRQVDQLVKTIDIPRTLASISGIPLGYTDSAQAKDWKTWIQGTGSGTLRTRSYHQYRANFTGADIPPWDLLETYPEGERIWEYVSVPDGDPGKIEFYEVNAADDPWELLNRNGEAPYAARQAVLYAELDAFRASRHKRIVRLPYEGCDGGGNLLPTAVTLATFTDSSTGTTFTLTVPTGRSVPAGTHLVATIMCGTLGQGKTLTVTDDAGNDWTAQHVADTTTNAATWILSCHVTNPLAAGQAVRGVVSPSGVGERWAALYNYANVKQFRQAAARATGTANAIVTSAPVDCSPHGLVIGTINYTNAGGALAEKGGSGWTFRDNYVGSGRKKAVQDGITYFEGEYVVTGQLEAPANWIAHAVSFDVEPFGDDEEPEPPEQSSQGGRYIRQWKGQNNGSTPQFPSISTVLDDFNRADQSPIDVVRNGTLTNGSPVVTGLSQTSDLRVGMFVQGTGIPGQSKIASVDSSSQITINQNATASGSQSLTMSFWKVSGLSGGRLTIVSNQASSSGNSTDAFSDTTPSSDFGPDCEARVTVRARIDSGAFKLFARLQQLGAATLDGYRLTVTAVAGPGNDTWELHKIVNGAPTLIASATREFAVGDQIAIECKGTQISGWHFDGSGWTQAVTVTDATVAAAGKLGLGMLNSSLAVDDFIGGTSIITSSGTAPSITLDSAPLEGSLVVVRFLWNVNGSDATMTATPSGFTEVGTEQVISGDIRQRVFYRVAPAGMSPLIQATLSASKDWLVDAVEVVGAGTPTLDEVSEESGTSTTPKSGTTAITGTADEYVVAFVGNKNFETPDHPLKRFTRRVAQSTGASADNGRVAGAMLDKLVAATGSFSTGATLSASRTWLGKIATFRVPTDGTGTDLTVRAQIGWAGRNAGVFRIGFSTIAPTDPASWEGYDRIGHAWTPDFGSTQFDDLTAAGDKRLKRYRVTRGRTNDLGAMQAAEIELVLKDLDGHYNPHNPTTPLAALLEPGKPVFVELSRDGGETYYGRFYGWIEEFDPDPLSRETIIRAKDFFEWLQLTFPIIPSVKPTTVGTVIGKILDAAEWTNPALRLIDPGDQIPDFSSDGSDNAISLIEGLLAIDPGGAFYQRGDGVIVYEHRLTKAARDIAQTITRMAALAPGSTIRDVVNKQVVLREGDSAKEQTAEDGVSRGKYGPRVGSKLTTKYLNIDREALHLAQAMIARNKDARGTIWSLSFINGDGARTRAAVERELLERVKVGEPLSGTAAEFHIETIVEAVSDNGKLAEVEWILSKAAAGERPFRIGGSALAPAVDSAGYDWVKH